jgi:hypothetical protein
MHDLIKNNQVIKSHEFGSDTPPVLHENKGVWVLRTVISPAYNSITQNRTLTKTVNDDSTTWTYVVTDKTEEQLSAEFNNIAGAKATEIDNAVVKTLLRSDLTEIADADLDTYASLFLVFQVGEAVKIGDRKQYQDTIWEVIQAHTTQLDWLPPDVPALWKKVYDPEIILPWEQRSAENPYMIGDKCTFNGHTWESKINTNTWSPESYPAGWTDLGEI